MILLIWTDWKHRLDENRLWISCSVDTAPTQAVSITPAHCTSIDPLIPGFSCPSFVCASWCAAFTCVLELETGYKRSIVSFNMHKRCCAPPGGTSPDSGEGKGEYPCSHQTPSSDSSLAMGSLVFAQHGRYTHLSSVDAILMCLRYSLPFRCTWMLPALILAASVLWASWRGRKTSQMWFSLSFIGFVPHIMMWVSTISEYISTWKMLPT
jgi:hypothetical protein